MSTIVQNRHIARLIVGAMSIDGTLGKKERQKLAATLTQIGMAELIADVGIAIDEDDGSFNMFEECKELLDSLGADAEEMAPVLFRIICDVVAADRFVSMQEASYLSAMARRLKLNAEQSKNIFRSVMADRRGRLEVAASGVDELLHPSLKQLLSFEGAEELVGELSQDSLEEMLHQAKEALEEGSDISGDDVRKALAALGLDRTATLDDAKDVWLTTINELNLPKMARLGETFVTAGINRITRINDAYKSVLHFHEHLESSRKAQTEATRLEKQIKRSQAPSNRDGLAVQIEEELTGVGVAGRTADEP
ncbi:MAG: hypothetical protein KDD69_09335 [Bdellovibrionales bacterium]|nr:hypothetical protein [Bdellovibrionales bacterium]